MLQWFFKGHPLFQNPTSAVQTRMGASERFWMLLRDLGAFSETSAGPLREIIGAKEAQLDTYWLCAVSSVSELSLNQRCLHSFEDGRGRSEISVEFAAVLQRCSLFARFRGSNGFASAFYFALCCLSYRVVWKANVSFLSQPLATSIPSPAPSSPLQLPDIWFRSQFMLFLKF